MSLEEEKGIKLLGFFIKFVVIRDRCLSYRFKFVFVLFISIVFYLFI